MDRIINSLRKVSLTRSLRYANVTPSLTKGGHQQGAGYEEGRKDDVDVMDVTPEMARAWREVNIHNRPVMPPVPMAPRISISRTSSVTRGWGLPKPTIATTFEIITSDTIIRVQGVKLKAWIERKRIDWHGLRGLLFFQRPMLE